MKRLLRHSVIWIRRNKPSGFIVLIMAVFIVAYTVIVKLDKDNRALHSNNANNAQKTLLPTIRDVMKFEADARGSKENIVQPSDSGVNVIHFKEGVVNKEAEIPKDILNDFAEDEEIEGEHTILYEMNNNPDIDDDEKDDAVEEEMNIGLPSENEQLMNDELGRNEEEIEENWDKYLNRDKGKSQSKGNLNQQHLRLQGVRTVEKSLNKKQKFTNLPKFVHVFDVFKDSQKDRDSISKNKCILLKTMHADSPICIHDPQEDEIISGSLMEKGTWEPNYLYITGSVLKLYPDMVFLDLGCNIGVYTILAAKLGHNVISVDPYKVNLRLLTKSLSMGSLRDRVTLLWNAVSDVHENVTVNGIIGNIGGTFVETAKDGKVEEDSDLATTIVLDDLVDMFIDKSVFMKMDVEAFELKALEGGPNFFKRIDVRFVLMEWIAHRGSSAADQIIKIMKDYGLYPHVNAHHNTKLEPENSASWPDNVLWIKY